MKQYFKTKVDLNGNSYQMIIDHERKTVEKGYFLFNPCFTSYIKTTKKSISEQYNTLVRSGYSEK